MSGLSDQKRYELSKICVAVQCLAGAEGFSARTKACSDQLTEVHSAGLPRDLLVGVQKLRATLAKLPSASAFEAEYITNELTFRAFDLYDRAMLYGRGQDANKLLGSNERPDVFDGEFGEDDQ